VDEHFRTNVPSVLAIGDLIAGPMLAHKAEDDGVAFSERLAGMKTHVNYDTVPGVIYTWPEVASVGQTEEQVKAEGRPCRVGKFPFSANARARCLDETEGLVKILADARTDWLLGVHVFGPRASELIAEPTLAMEYAGSAEDVAAKIELLRSGQETLDRKVTVMLNKPVGFVSSQRELGYRNAMELLKPENQAPGEKMKWQQRDLFNQLGNLVLQLRGPHFKTCP
jgi:pyruvate/2-oxoglutarate dehydrogenase complex dihydrolipoamide dehydrogenase (E3) component